MQGYEKILLAVDGSDNALEMVRYAGQFVPFKNMKMVLYNVSSSIPDTYWDIEMQPGYAKKIHEVKAWERQQKKVMKEYMDKAVKLLIKGGIPDSSIKVKIHDREKGIARDIIKEAKKDYIAVLVGRKGLSNLKDIVLGSVAIKLLEKLNFATLIVVGEKSKDPMKFLFALDGSENSMSAVKYVGDFIGGKDISASLVHVVRASATHGLGYERFFSINEDIDKVKEKMNVFFDKAKEHLVNVGFKPDAVSSRIISGAQSRAVEIIKEAGEEGCGSIVVGRRGLSRVKEFFIGRVSNKIIHMAREHVVWVVS